jgi:predicted 3-demethylubiquinone-9 3-methyltransferase (glyoxalase superfamily)
LNRSFSIIVECEDKAGIDRLSNALKGGGSGGQCAWLRGRGGLCWQIMPQRRGELMNESNPARARRIGEARLKMVKFNIAEIQGAVKDEYS